MELMAYQKLRGGLQANVPAATGEVLEAARLRLQAALEGCGAFDQIEVGSTDNPDRLLVSMVTYHPDLSEQDVVDTLEQMWRDDLRDVGWGAHAFLVEDRHVEFEAATISGGARHFVSMHIVATAGVVGGIPAQRPSPLAHASSRQVKKGVVEGSGP